MTFHPSILLIFSIEMQHIYPISKQEVPLTRGIVDAPVFYGNTDVRSQDWQQRNATDHWCLHKTNNALLHI